MTDGAVWKWISLAGIIATLALWVAAAAFGWVKSVTFVSHLSLAALVLSFLAAWRSDES